MRVLLVEDDARVASFVRRGLVAEGMAVDVEREGAGGFHQALHGAYDVIVLDLMLPHVDGLEILRGLRTHGRDVPVLVLTAKDAVGDRVAGLHQGADDYLGKPFAFAELLARIQALIRRRTPRQVASVLSVADLRLDLARRQVTRAGRPIELTAKEFSLLEYLLRNADQIVTRTMIGEHVWDQNFDSFTNVIDVYVCYLRAKIDEGFAPPLLHTVRGAGYMLSERAP